MNPIRLHWIHVSPLDSEVFQSGQKNMNNTIPKTILVPLQQVEVPPPVADEDGNDAAMLLLITWNHTNTGRPLMVTCFVWLLSSLDQELSLFNVDSSGSPQRTQSAITGVCHTAGRRLSEKRTLSAMDSAFL